jgi:hypothetical protein
MAQQHYEYRQTARITAEYDRYGERVPLPAPAIGAYRGYIAAGDYVDSLVDPGDHCILTQPIDCTGDPLDDWEDLDEVLADPRDVQAALIWHQGYCPSCDDSPCTCADNCCTECGSVEPCGCFDEDDSASEVTGYDNGPTYW